MGGMRSGKRKNTKNRKSKSAQDGTKRELVLKTEGQEYARVVKALGNGRFDVHCFDGEKRQCHVRGAAKYKKNRIWIHVGDIILVSLRDFQNDKCDLLHKYTPDEAMQLKNLKEIPENVKINEVDLAGEDEDSGDEYFDFNEGESSDDDVDVDEL